MEYKVKLTFTSEWLVASGLGDGYVADNELTRDSNGVLFLGGRALRGALRESAWRLALCRDDLKKAENFFFGTASTAVENEKCGCLTVSDGLLSDGVHDYFTALNYAERSNLMQDLITYRVQTSLQGESKLVKKGSLRTLQCGIAGIIFEFSLIVDAKVKTDFLNDYLLCLCSLTRSIGSNRSRGLGNCELELFDSKGCSIAKSGSQKLPSLFDDALGE